MKKSTVGLTSVLVFGYVLAGCGQPPPPSSTTPAEDPRVAEIKKSIAAKTTPESRTILEKVKAMKPERNTEPGGKTLAEEADASTTITPIGWEASKKTAQDRQGRWKIIFHYRDSMKQILAAEWEYDPVANKVYPFDMNNAPTFWSPAPPDAKAAKGRKPSK